MAHNNIAVRFDHQKFIYMRAAYHSYAPDYVLIDNRAGQNPNNFLFAPTGTEMIESLKQDSNYTIMYHAGDQYIFQRKK